jgi:hypothetical protein
VTLYFGCFIHQVLLGLKTKGLFEPKSTPLRMKSRIMPRKTNKAYSKKNNLIIKTSRKQSFLTAKPACIAGVRTSTSAPKSSRQRELPPPPLTEPYVKLSLHTAPIVEPKDIHSYSTSRRAQGLVWRYVLTTFLLCDAFL